MPFVKKVKQEREIGEGWCHKITKDYDPDKFYTKEELQKLYVKLAKRADQRLVRLQALQHEQGFKNVTMYAYRTAQTNIKKMGADTSKGLLLFNKKQFYSDNLTMTQLHSNLNKVIQFLDSPTSTRQGIEKIYQKRAEQFFEWVGNNLSKSELTKIKRQDPERYNAIMDEKPTWQMMYNYFSSGNAEKIDNAMGYKNFFQAVRIIAGSKGKINPKTIRDPVLRGDIKIIQNDKSLDDMARKMIKELQKDDSKASPRDKTKGNKKEKVRKGKRK